MFLKTWWAWAGLAILALISIWMRSSKFKGKIGEKGISDILSKFPDDEYILLNDIMLPNENGTSQIDHILVSVYGIFVIETKNYQGLIYGSEKSYSWTQNIYGNKSSFKNPVHQNYGHIKAIEKCLEKYGEFPVIPIVVFSDKAELHIESVNSAVINRRNLSVFIKERSVDKKIPAESIGKIAEAINLSNITDRDSRKKHVTDIKSKKLSDKAKADEGICPKCGGKLVVRHGKNGDFMGCSCFPKCHYTKSI